MQAFVSEQAMAKSKGCYMYSSYVYHLAKQNKKRKPSPFVRDLGKVLLTWHHDTLLRVPTRTGKPGKPGKMGRHFPVREKSGNLEQTGKVREKSGKITQNTGKIREFEIILFDIFNDI